MGVETIIRALDSYGVSSVDLILADTNTMTSNSVVFRVLFDHEGEQKKFDHTISTPKNEPYSCTGRESKNYPVIWDCIRGQVGTDPLTLLALGLARDYSANLPNALHLAAGFMESYDEFARIAGHIEIRRVGGRPRDAQQLAALSRMLDGLYEGLLFGDASERITQNF